MRRDSVPGGVGTGRRVRSALALALIPVLLAACGRSNHYAPVVNGSGGAVAARPAAESQSAGSVTVRSGDSLYKIAQRYSVPLRALIDANRVAPPYRIYPGQKLKLPSTGGHIVKDGDTVYQVAAQYGIEPGTLVRLNRLSPPYRLVPGQRLTLPDGRGTDVAAALAAPGRAVRSASPRAAEPAASPKPEPAASPRSDTVTAAAPPPDPVPAKQAAAPAAPRTAGPPPARSGGGFLWPVDGKLLSRFGSLGKGLQNDGINISAARGAPVRAVENGVVAYSGNELRGFGNLLLIKHAGGWISAYAHNSQLLVRTGDTVKKGQVIAHVGSTGSVDRPQLHFELRRGNRAVDPERYLGQQSALWLLPTGVSRAFS